MFLYFSLLTCNQVKGVAVDTGDLYSPLFDVCSFLMVLPGVRKAKCRPYVAVLP